MLQMEYSMIKMMKPIIACNVVLYNMILHAALQGMSQITCINLDVNSQKFPISYPYGWRKLNLLKQLHAVPWGSYQTRKIVVCACARNAGNVFLPPTSKETAS